MKPFISPIVGHMHNHEYLARVLDKDAIKNHLLAQMPSRERALFNDSMARFHARFPNAAKGHLSRTITKDFS